MSEKTELNVSALVEALSVLIRNWDDLKPGDSAHVDTARNFLATYRATAPSQVAADVVQVPREPTVEMLVAISHAMGVVPLGDGSDGSYPITGSQSTARQVYSALLATSQGEG